MSEKKTNNQKAEQGHPLALLPDDARMLLKTVMENFHVLEPLVSKLWWRQAPFADALGVIAIVTLATDVQAALAHVPVLARIVNEHTLSYVEVMQLFSMLGSIPGDVQIGMGEKAITLQLCLPISVPEGEAAAALDALQDGILKMRADLQRALEAVLGSSENQPPSYPRPSLPKIKAFPEDLEVIFGVLSCCPGYAQEVYGAMIKKWDRQGGIITTTGTSVCLDMPYGNRQARLAMLLPGYAKEQPLIALFWESLKRLEGLPLDAIQTYFNAVEKITPLRKTESSAYIAVTQEFTQAKALSLLIAMKTLAAAVIAEKVEAMPESKPRAEPNIEATLSACPSEWVQLYQQLIQGWRAAGGIVHCPKAGRIYLRFKTHPHLFGQFSKTAHTFNLLVLAAPKGKRGCQVDVAWGLATALSAAYLDCIPEDVNRFEAAISGLPGFIQEGVVTRIKLGPGFEPKHGQKLLEASITLKAAEEKAK
jgi:hypothetical protein